MLTMTRATSVEDVTIELVLEQGCDWCDQPVDPDDVIRCIEHGDGGHLACHSALCLSRTCGQDRG